MKHFENAKYKFNELPLYYKLLMWFVFFSFIMLTLLWICQTVFLDTFYRMVRVGQVKDCAESVEKNFSESMSASLLEDISEQNDIRIYFYDVSSSVINPLYSTDKNFMWFTITDQTTDETNDSDKEDTNKDDDKTKDKTKSTHKGIFTFSSEQLIRGRSAYSYYESAVAEDGEYVTFTDDSTNNSGSLSNITDDSQPPMDKLGTENVVYTKIFTSSEDNDYMIILSTQISPVESIISTIRYLLLSVTGILIIIGIFIAIFASRRISKPITETTKLARKLAEKDYDITFDNTGYHEVTELNKTLSYAAGELKKVDDLQRELIANISHDLRTPLTMITGYGEVMRDLPGENTPENIQIIIDEANRLNMLVTDLLDISKIQSGTTKLSPEDFSITDLIKDLFNRYNKLKEQDGYNFIFEYEEDITVNADFSKINQVIYNLMNNAINYAGEDKTIIVRQKNQKNKVLIEVEDHGKGIDQQHLENIWDRYYKVDKAHRSSVVGTGLGLSIVKNILDLHKTHYGVKSVVGEGSVFWFELKTVIK